MGLSHDLISQFVKVTNDRQTVKKETIAYGTAVELDGKKYVRLDGSEMLTPVSSTADAEANERVTVLIKDHTAAITGNASSPAARKQSVDDAVDQITKVEILVANKVSTEDLDAERGRINTLVSENVTIKERLTASEANIDNLEANTVSTAELNAQKARIDNLETNMLTVGAAEIKYATIQSLQATDGEFRNLKSDYGSFKSTTTDKLTAVDADIENLETNKLSASEADIKYASVGNLEAVQADVNSLDADYASFKTATADNFIAVNASIDNLEATKLSAESADLKYANIDFANIGEAAVEKFYAVSGIIQNLTLETGVVVKELIGVLISGDLIKGNTIQADKLIVRGEDGLYYKLNVDALGETTASADPKYQNGLDGSVIIAKSVTAEKVSVDDLVAFGATIGGFHITNSSIYSGVKTEPTNTTTGVYFDKDGQMAVGDATNFIKYSKDQNGVYKLEISADSILFGSSKKSVETELTEVKTTADGAKSTAETAQSTANAAKSAADTAKSTADGAQEGVNSLTTRVTNAETIISQNSEAIELRAKKTELTEVKTTAETAQSTANTAKTTADTAKSTADTAKSTADGAQEGVNSLTTKVTNAETIIKQNSEAITLRATSESVSKDITDTNSKITKLQAQFDVQAKSIASLIRNGETGSLLKQDAEDLYFFDISGLETSLSENADEIKKTNESISKISDDTEYLKTKTEYIAVGTDDNDKPYIELGEGDSKFKVKITNEKIEFKDGASTPAYITNQKLMINNSEVKNELRFGNFVWKLRGENGNNGNLGLIWEEANS